MILPTISVLGGHSALEICSGTKKIGFKTLVIVQKGRDKTYSKYFRNLVDNIILVDKFAELTSKDVIAKLQKHKAIFIPHRYVQVYCNLSSFEKKFPVPVFGNKHLLKYEEREGKYNQYSIFKEADIDYPRQFQNPKLIDRLCLVKVRERERNYERAFFFAGSFKEYTKKGNEFLKNGKVKKDDLQNAVIEEFIIGAQINFNFFYSNITGKLELLSTDTRRQTNIDGLLRLPAIYQQLISEYITPSYIETGHISITIKESLLEKAFELAEKILKASKKFDKKGIIGPFALQTAVIPGPPKEKIIVFDLSLRIPGSPGTAFTPYSHYLYPGGLNFGDRVALEIKKALNNNKINLITT